MSLLSCGKGGVEKFDVLNIFIRYIKNDLFFVAIPTRAYFLQTESRIGIFKKIGNGIGTGLCTRA